MALDGVEGFGAAQVSLSAALIFSHELHQNHDQLMDCLVVDPGVLWEQVFDDAVIFRTLDLVCFIRQQDEAEELSREMKMKTSKDKQVAESSYI